MPTYAFKCRECGRLVDNKFLSITHKKADTPECCGKHMGYHITHPPMVHWKDPVIEPFRHIATPDKPLITTTKEHREYMKRHDLVDANELGPPPSQSEQMKEAAEMKKSIDAISGTAEQKQRLKEDGLDSIL